MNISSQSSPAVSHRRFIAGVTLIEMMISLTIGLIIIASVGYAYLGSKANFRTQDALSRMQEGARTAFEMMERDLRMAGFTGCPPNPAASGDINILTSAADWDKNLTTQPLMGLTGQPLIGYEKGAEAWSAFPAGVTGVTGSVLAGDALTVLRADNSEEFIVASHDTAASQLTLTANHNIQQGEILIVAKDNCTRTAIFQKTNSGTNAIVQHGRDNVTTTYPLGLPLSTPDTFGANSRIFRLKAATYYIGSNPDGEPALYREALGASGGNPATSAEELIEGVQDMQLTYGLDTTGDGAVDSYSTADAVADWSQVLGIRVSLLMVSRQDEQGITTQAQTYTYNGTTVTSGDRLLRKVFTTTIAIKNR